MEELDAYGSFNTHYEGVGKLVYLPGEPVPVYFEVRQLMTGQLLVACVSTEERIKDNPVTLNGYLLSGEPFSTMWGQRIKEVYRSDGKISKAHYFVNMTRVRYTADPQPDNHSVKIALHNFLPGNNYNVPDDQLGKGGP